MAAPSKAQFLTDVHTLLKRRYKLEPKPPRMTVLEAVVYGICHEDTTREQANQAISRFKDEFFDWNEVRVSSVQEIQGVLAGLPDPEDRARRVRRFLRQLFVKTYGFTLDILIKKPQKDAVKALHEYEALRSDYVLSTVIQQALGGHAIPIDAPIRRALERLGVTEPGGTDDHALRSTLERLVPKNRGTEFVDLMEELAHDTCIQEVPLCGSCELRKLCPVGQQRVAEEKAASRIAAKAARSKQAETAVEPPAAPSKPAGGRKKTAETDGATTHAGQAAKKAPKSPKK